MERNPKVRASQRCAIYTRVSSDAGLDQDFNSLDNQREAAEAFVKSQEHEGWSLIDKGYNDGGFSGGSIARPGLSELLADVQLGKVDIVVVYKVDRLTRSLADFAKLVELFDAHQVSFVSVTQAFNTTNSMGRLTLNVLLSFAQFEREVTGERIRDKIAASKRKGMWMGGVVPFGYRVENKRLIVHEPEAAQVRSIFERYLELRSAQTLAEALEREGFRTRRRVLADGRAAGGKALTRGPLTMMLRNRIYVGEITHKGQVYPGAHQPVIDLRLFNDVQEVLNENRSTEPDARKSSGALLAGKIYDHRGRPMTPTYAQKGSTRYRYYVSSTTRGDKQDPLRLPAYEAERRVIEALVQVRGDAGGKTAKGLNVANMSSEPQSSDHVCHAHLVATHIEQAAFGQDFFEIHLRQIDHLDHDVVRVPWQRERWNKRKILSNPEANSTPYPIRAEARARMLYAIARARRWVKGLINGRFLSLEQIAAVEGCSIRSVRMTLPLAFLSPTIVQAAVSGTLRDGVGLSSFSDGVIEWKRQEVQASIL